MSFESALKDMRQEELTFQRPKNCWKRNCLDSSGKGKGAEEELSISSQSVFALLFANKKTAATQDASKVSTN